MFTRVKHIAYLLPLLCLLRTPAAHAQWAVIDVGAIAQLIQEVELVQQEVNTAQGELAQVRSTYQSMTGGRGMQNLLGGINRTYLPTDLNTLQAVLAGNNAAFPQLAGEIQQLVGQMAILTPAQVASLSPAEQAQVTAARGNAALLQSLAGEALSTTSARFASLQQLIAAIGNATDQKGALDLQARIAAEQTMLANDQSKLQALYRAADAQELAREQSAREQAIADIGSFRNLPPMGL
ncbi:MAG: type IV secretion system protein [Steroidobacteraceae bacterium]